MASPARRLRVARTTPRAQVWLEQTQQAHVLYSFERVLNLVNQESNVLSLVADQIGAGPFSLVLYPGEFPNDVEVGASLLVFENGFWLDDWLIDAEQADSWNPVPKWRHAISSADTAEWATQILKIELTHHAELDSLARLVINPVANSPLPAKILQTAEQNIPLLFSSIDKSDSSLLRKSAKGLAGLGPGLTPAGDDLLLGAMHGVWATRPEEEARNICNLIAGAAAPRTHVLSASWLEAAAEGEAAEPWHMLVNVLAAKDEKGLRNAISRILPTGHTSGSDALGGFLGILERKLD